MEYLSIICGLQSLALLILFILGQTFLAKRDRWRATAKYYMDSDRDRDRENDKLKDRLLKLENRLRAYELTEPDLRERLHMICALTDTETALEDFER